MRGWTVFVTVMCATAAVASDECACVNTDQQYNAISNPSMFFQQPTFGGEYPGHLDKDDLGYSLQAQIVRNELGDGIIIIYGLVENVTISSATPLGLLQPTSLCSSITIDFTESSMNDGAFMIVVQKVQVRRHVPDDFACDPLPTVPNTSLETTTTVKPMCECVNPNQRINAISNPMIFFQEPTLLGQMNGKTCNKNCTFTASLDRDDPYYSLQAWQWKHRDTWIGTHCQVSIMSSLEINHPLRIVSTTKTDVLEPKSISDSITIEFTESIFNSGVFLIVVQKVPGRPTMHDENTTTTTTSTTEIATTPEIAFECACVDPDQHFDAILNPIIFFQQPTLGGVMSRGGIGETCSMNCTFKASMDNDDLEYYLQVQLLINSLGDGILAIHGLEEQFTIVSTTDTGSVIPKSLGRSITIEFTESSMNDGEFRIAVERVRKEEEPSTTKTIEFTSSSTTVAQTDIPSITTTSPPITTPNDSVSSTATSYPPILAGDTTIDVNVIVLIVIGCAILVLIAFLIIVWCRNRRIQVPEKIEMHEPEPEPIDTKTAEFSSRFLNEFDVISIRGVGGFGCVFHVINKYDKWEYAVKRIAVDKRKMETALVEAQAMAQLDHLNIVRYNGAWTEEPPIGWQDNADCAILKNIESSGTSLMNSNSDSVFLYIQMQLCNHSLSDWLKENMQPDSRSIPRMKLWFRQIVSAVEYIHSKNIIHRDLKPSNVLFFEEDHLKLCDLGIATQRRNVEDVNNTLITRTNIGTALYMSPEQLSFFTPYSSKSEVFTLGLMLAELCAVMTPNDRTEIFDNLRHGYQCAAFQDAKTAEFIATLTQLEPRSRPTCREMLDHPFLSA